MALGRPAVGHGIAGAGAGGPGRMGRPAVPSPRPHVHRGVIRAAWYAGAAVVAAAASLLSGVARPDAGGEAATMSGAELFRVKGCATCHSGPEGAGLIGGAPSLANVAAWAGERMPDVSADEYVELSIRNPSAFISPRVHRPDRRTRGRHAAAAPVRRRDRRPRVVPPRSSPTGVVRRERVGRTYRPSGGRRPSARRGG